MIGTEIPTDRCTPLNPTNPMPRPRKDLLFTTPQVVVGGLALMAGETGQHSSLLVS